MKVKVVLTDESGKELFQKEGKDVVVLVGGEDTFVQALHGHPKKLMTMLSSATREVIERTPPSLSALIGLIQGLEEGSKMSETKVPENPGLDQILGSALDDLGEAHDCDNCDASGHCPLESVVRQHKATKEEASATREGRMDILDILKHKGGPKGSDDIN
jgi:hypothetical protein